MKTASGAALLTGAVMLTAALGNARGESAAPAPVRDAEIMPLAASGLLLDIVNTGKHLIAVGDRGNIVVSNDGVGWAQVPAPIRSALTAVTFADADHGWAVGHDAVILHTQDAGRSWTMQHFAPELEQPILDVYFLNRQRGYAVGAYGLFLQTTDGGQSWEEVEAPAIRDDEYHFNALLQLGDGSFFVVGEIGMMGWSADGGEWMRLQAPYEGTLFGAVARGRRGAIIYGLRGNVYLTDDVNSGEWTKIETNSVQSMYGGTILPNGNPAMVGLNGSVMVLRPDGSVQLDKVESIAGTLGSGTLANAVPWEDGLIAVGELGVSSVQLDR